MTKIRSRKKVRVKYIKVCESKHNRASSPLLFLFQYQLNFFSFLLTQKHRLVTRYWCHDWQMTNGG